MKNVFKTIALAFIMTLASCSKDDAKVTTPGGAGGLLAGSYIKGNVGGFSYDSTVVGGQTNGTKIALPFVGDQLAIASLLSDTKTLNLTFFVPVGTGETEGVLFYSPNGTQASTIGNDDNCPDVQCFVNVTKNDGKVIEGTYTARLKKADCSGDLTNVTNGMFKAVVAL